MVCFTIDGQEILEVLKARDNNILHKSIRKKISPDKFYNFSKRAEKATENDCRNRVVSVK